MLEKLQQVLRESYSADLCYPPATAQWSKDNPTFGMCAITALVLQDYLGGEIYKVSVGGVSHYFNLIGGEAIDLTAEQFGYEINYNNKTQADRSEMLPKRSTEKRYLELRRRVEDRLDNKKRQI